MWKLLAILGLGMFLTLLIGGRDQGQVRHGLRDLPASQPLVTAAAFDPAKIAPAEPIPDTTDIAALVPVAAPAPAAPAPAPVPEVAVQPAPVPEAVVETATGAAPETPAALPLRYVNAGTINLRDGPSTASAVIGRLTRNEAVSVVGDAGDGWVLVRLEGDGAEGYVAARLLTDREP